MKGLKTKNVLVTGAATGIGRAIAIRFAQEGANVAVNFYKSKEKAEETKEQMLIEQACDQIKGYGVKHLLVQGDISQEEDVKNIFASTSQELGGIDILINNAGIQMSAASHELEMDKFDRMIAVNVRGAYLCARVAIQHFLEYKKPGVIINNSSVHEVIPRPEYIGYSVSKGGMENLTRTLALEYAGRGIRVNAIGPGATATPINEWTSDPDAKAEVESHIPMRRAGSPEEMAGVVAFLASDEAAYITGQTLFVDGGLTLYPDFRQPWS
ncbi:MAG: glucose 1-dehydrogenase [Cyanobacteria bacterium P01_A01_bin.84]